MTSAFYKPQGVTTLFNTIGQFLIGVFSSVIAYLIQRVLDKLFDKRSK